MLIFCPLLELQQSGKYPPLHHMQRAAMKTAVKVTTQHPQPVQLQHIKHKESLCCKLRQEEQRASWWIISRRRELHQSLHFRLKLSLTLPLPPPSNPQPTALWDILLVYLPVPYVWSCLNISSVRVRLCSFSLCPERMTGLWKAWLSPSFNSSRLIADPNRPN